MSLSALVALFALLRKGFGSLQGIRTYLAAGSAVAASLAGFVGLIPNDKAQALAVTFGGLAAICLRLSHSNSVSELLKLLQDASIVVPDPNPVPGPSDASNAKPGDGLDLKSLTGMLILAICMGSVGIAAPPKAVITGADPSVAGELIELSAMQSEGDPKHFSWEITPELKGRRQMKSVDGGQSVFFASFPGRYLVTLAVSNMDGHSIAHRELVIPGSVPPNPTPQPDVPSPLPNPAPGPAPAPPAPNPGPPPGPAPAPEQPLTGIALSTYNAAMQVKSPNRANEALCLANKCQGLSSSIAAGAFNNPIALMMAQGIVTEMGKIMDQCTTPAWSDARELVAAKIESSWKAGSLKTAADWKAILDQIEQGLRRVK